MPAAQTAWRETVRTRPRAWRLCAWLLITWPLCAAVLAEAAEPRIVLQGAVIRVIDGDTLDVRLDSGRIRVRLHGVDAPEADQPGGAAATLWLRKQLQNEAVQIEPHSQDRYDRMLAIVYRDDRNINGALVRAGHAWAYRRYLRVADRPLCDLEALARRERLGVWAEASPHAPWEFRATAGKGPFTDFSRSNARECRQSQR